MKGNASHEAGRILAAESGRRLRLLALALGVAAACLIGLWLPLAAARADEPTFPGRISFGQKDDRTVAVATGDLDGDGDLDVVTGGGRSNAYRNDGTGGLREMARLPEGVRDLAVGDLDGDGDLDIALVGVKGKAIYQNLGDGKFEPIEGAIDDQATTLPSLALGDLNGDGAFDIVVGSSDGPTVVYTNTGSATFASQAIKIGAEISGTSSLALGRLDDDGCLDVAVAHSAGASIAYLSQRDWLGVCTLQFTAVPFGINVTDTRKVLLGDFDGDERLDILAIAGSPYGAGGEPHHLYRNDGQGRFPDALSHAFGRGEGSDWGAAAGDLDGDGRLDLAVGLGTLPPVGNVTWLNQVYLNAASDAAPVLRLASNFGPGTDETRAIALADMNNDGALDIVAGNYQGFNAIHFGGGELQPDVQLAPTGRGEIIAVEIGDASGDGMPDIVAGAMTGTLIFTDNGGLGRSLLDPFDIGKARRTLALADVVGGESNGPEIIVGYDSFAQTAVYSRTAAGVWSRQPFGPADAPVIALASGDLDSDGRVDIVLGRSGAPNYVCYNQDEDPDQWSCEALPVLNTGQSADTRSVALADVNGDDSPDIIAAVRGDANIVYLNDGAGGFERKDLHVFGPGDDISHAVAAGDLDGDHAPDIVIGNFFEPSAVYFNDGKGDFAATPSLLLGDANDLIYDLALVDFDNDGDLDIAAANWGSNANAASDSQPYANVLYVNDGKGHFIDQRLDTDNSLGWTQSLAVGDLDGDGLPEIVAGNRYRDNQPFSNRRIIIYRYPSQRSSRLPNGSPYAIIDAPSAPDQTATAPVRYRLFDPDGESLARVEAFVRSPGDAGWRPAASAEATPTLVQIASELGSSHVFTLDLAASDLTTQTQDALLRLLVSPQLPFSPEAGYAYTSSTPGPFQHPATLTSAMLPTRPKSTSVAVDRERPVNNHSGALIYRSADPDTSLLQPLRDPDGAPMQTLPDGRLPRRVRLARGDQLAAVWNSGEPLTYSYVYTRQRPISLNTLAQFDCQPPMFRWISQGLFRTPIQVQINSPIPERAYSQVEAAIKLPAVRGIHHLKILLQALTQGDSSRIVDRQIELLVPRSNGAYQVIPSGEGIIDLQQLGEQEFDLNGVDFERDWLLRATLRGCGDVQIDWQIGVEASPLYYTSAGLRADGQGLKLTDVATPGDPLTLTVDQPLLVFDLDVAVEWDAHNDSAYRQQLQQDILRASQLLYDWTNGQAVLGNVNVYLDARRFEEEKGFQPWLDSDVRIFASNRIRPSASQGGVVSEPFTETLEIDGQVQNKAYYPGQVHMGLTWNRYGEQNTLGDDWPRALAHELGHYLFFLEDNYVGYSDGEEKMLVSVSGCPGAMADPYRDDTKKGYDEFTADTTWENPDLECGRTLSDQETRRSDWGTIEAFYPWLRSPEEIAKEKTGRTTLSGKGAAREPEKCDRDGGEQCLVIEGPTRLVLDLTQVSFTSPPAVDATMVDPILTTVDDKGRTLAADANARVYLFKGGFQSQEEAQLLDLGRPRLDQVFAHGAAEGDQLCVLGGRWQGCARASEREIALQERAEDWLPDIALAPANNDLLAMTVTLPSELDSGIALCVRMYPLDGDAYETLRLSQPVTGTPVYTGTYALRSDTPLTQGYVHVWSSDASDQARSADTGAVAQCGVIGNESYHAMVDFMIGSSPAFRKSTGAFRKSTGAFRKSTGAPFRSSQAPVMSSDGQFVLYWDTDLTDGEFLTIQTAAAFPDLPPGAQVVGEAYRLVAVPATLDLSDAFINFGYLGRDVPEGQEGGLGIYYRDQATGAWQPLPTRVDPGQNQASARARGGGLYALLARLEIPLRPGWNLVGYPLPTPDLASRVAVSESLNAIAGHYSIVYGFDPAQPSEPWQVFDPNTPAWASSLGALDFGRGYLLYVTEPVTLSLSGGFSANTPYTMTKLALAGAKTQAPEWETPPAHYYISITRTSERTFSDDALLTAWVNGDLCGQGLLHRLVASESFTATIAVPGADVENPPACQGEGKEVEFRLGEAVIGSQLWDNTQVQEIILAGQAPSCRNLLRNGDFESAGGWTFLDTRIPARIVASDGLDGNHHLQLGAPPERPAPRRSGRSIAHQTFTLPTQAAGMTLDFTYLSGSTAAANETPRLLVFDRRNLRQLAAAPLPLSAASGWEDVAIDLSAYGGRTLLLSFELTYNPRPAGAHVWLNVDDVRACAPP